MEVWFFVGNNARVFSCELLINKLKRLGERMFVSVQPFFATPRFLTEKAGERTFSAEVVQSSKEDPLEICLGFCANADYSCRNEMFSFARIDADTVEMLCTACCKDDTHPKKKKSSILFGITA